MSKRMGIVLLTAVMPALLVSAQQNKPFKERVLQQQRNKMKEKVDLNSEPSCAPGDELTVQEFSLKRTELKGQVVELEFDRVIDLQQIGDGYAARVTFESVRAAEGLKILVPNDGLEFFEPLADRRGPVRKTVYVEVITGDIVRALGTRYSKGKPEGERYNW